MSISSSQALFSSLMTLLSHPEHGERSQPVGSPMQFQASALPSASLKATLIERSTNAINVPEDGAVLAGAQVVVDFVF